MNSRLTFHVSRITSCIFLILIIIFLPSQAKADFKSYLSKEEPEYRWEEVSEKIAPQGKIYELRLVSQTWQGITWEHKVQIFYPDNVEYPKYCAILITGGKGSTIVDTMGMSTAKACGTVLAVLWNIPNQPLFDGKVEDALIAYTWLKYLETKDENWPLLFPMAKSVIKCMNSIEEFSKKKGLIPVENFIITGASKRGWTTWMAGASQDKRIKAIIPMVIDTLNMKAQLAHQMEVYGSASKEIHDYSSAGVLDKLNTKEGEKLLELIDPYSYRNTLILPKLIINGTNDQYWTVDSMNLYWDNLKGPKWVLYVPNSGHGLEDFWRVINTSTSFIYTIAGKKPWPEIKWTFKENKEKVTIKIESNINPKTVNIFTAYSDTKDFRKSKWNYELGKEENGYFSRSINKPEKGFCAIFGEINYELEGKKFSLSTQIKIVKYK